LKSFIQIFLSCIYLPLLYPLFSNGTRKTKPGSDESGFLLQGEGQRDQCQHQSYQKERHRRENEENAPDYPGAFFRSLLRRITTAIRAANMIASAVISAAVLIWL
jgi:hypothetical protein